MSDAHIVCESDSSFPKQISPIDSNNHGENSSRFSLTSSNGTFLHSKGVAEGIKVKLVTVLLPDTLLDKFVPIECWERSVEEWLRGQLIVGSFHVYPKWPLLCRYNQFVPIGFDVIIFGLFGQVKAIEFQSSGNLFFPFEDCQGYLKVVVGNQHAE